MAQLWPGLGGPAINYISGAPDERWRATTPRGLVLLGSTGSIGRNTLAVAAAHPQAFRMHGAILCTASLFFPMGRKFRPNLRSPWIFARPKRP